MHVDYDTIVIGAGLSGLAAGIRLAHFGDHVCVLERHTTIGGLNSFYRLRGRNYDVGLHAVTNYVPPGSRSGPLSRLVRQLRLRWDDFALAPQQGSAIAFPEKTLAFDNDFERFQSEVERQFPDQRDGFRKLLEHIAAHEAFAEGGAFQSTRSVIGRFISDPLLVDMLLCVPLYYGGARPNDLDYSDFVILFRSIFQEGLGRPRGGIRTILKALVRRFRSAGGELLLRHSVQAILTQGDRAVGVRLDDGRTLTARRILSSAGGPETMRLCGLKRGDSRFPPGTLSFVEVIYTLDRPPAAFGHHRTMLFFNRCSQLRYRRPEQAVGLDGGIVCTPDNFQYDEPPTQGTLRITALADPSFWINADDAEYASAKQHWRRRLTETALEFVPDFRPYVIDVDMFTPRTIRKFTGHLNGAVYGSPHKQRDGRTHLENVFLCGTDQGLVGIVGAMMSGVTIANRCLMQSAH